MTDQDRLISGNYRSEDLAVELSLRPVSLPGGWDWWGQVMALLQLNQCFLKSQSKRQQESLDRNRQTLFQ